VSDPAIGVTLGDDGVLELALRWPPLNEIGLTLLGELEQGLDRLPDARGVLLHSEQERGFCAGADLRALHQAIEERGHAAVGGEVRAFLERVRDAFLRLDEAPIPVVGAVHGVCFGGGFELALCCDLLVADRTARFGFPELRLGLVPGFGGTVRLRRAAPTPVLRDLLLTGRSLGAERAHALGLVSQVVGPGKHLAVARRCLAQALRHDPVVTATAQRLVTPDLRAELDAEIDAFCALFARPEAAAGLAAFAAREDAFPYLA
jgi:enoyl-CoA hydratase/carnithine racemase